MKASPNYIVINESDGSDLADVSVLISLHNYESFVQETLESVFNQSLKRIELIVVNDCSIDKGEILVKSWLSRNGGRFTRAMLLTHRKNEGLAAARNTAIASASSNYVFILDADNLIYPRCLELHLETLRSAPKRVAFSFSILSTFGAQYGLMGTNKWSVTRLSRGNYIDAMALIRRDCLTEVDGYKRMCVTGWEDYELWCTFAEKGWSGLHIPQVLARYRVHSDSMLRSITNNKRNYKLLTSEMRERHPWLMIN